MVCAHACVLSSLVHPLPGDWAGTLDPIQMVLAQIRLADREGDQATSQLDSLVTFDKIPVLGLLDPAVTTLQL